jgi:hypothetical protein
MTELETMEDDDRKLHYTTGRLCNMTNEFSEDKFCLVKGRNDPYAINLSFESSRDLKVGNYTLTIGARFDNVTYNKLFDMYIK